MIGKLLYNTFSAITDWKSTTPTGCYPIIGSMGAILPFLVYDVVDIEPSPTKDSPTSELDTYTVNISAYADTMAVANDIIEKYISELDRITPGTIAGIKLQSLRIQSRGDDYNDDLEAYITTAQYKFRIIT
jgi:hypothetical protein